MYLYVYVFQTTVFVVLQMYNRRYCKFYQFSIRLSKWIRDTYFWTMHIFFNEINIELFYSFLRKKKRLVSRDHHLFGIPRLKLHQVLQYVYLGSSGQILNAHHPLKMVSHASLLVFLPSFFFIHINLYILLYHNRRGSCPCFCYLLECLV